MTSIIELIRPEAAFDPETIATLSAALEEAWDRLLRSGSEGTRPAYARAMREVVARRIIDMAQHGVRDQAELAKGAVRFLAVNYRLDEKRLPLKLGDVSAHGREGGLVSQDTPPIPVWTSVGFASTIYRRQDHQTRN